MTPDQVILGPLAELGKYGLLGALLIFAGVVIWLQRGENKALVTKLSDLLVENAKQNVTLANALEKLSDTTEERNRVTQNLAKAVNRAAEATKFQADISELQTTRIMDRIGASEKVATALSEAVRAIDQDSGRNTGRRPA